MERQEKASTKGSVYREQLRENDHLAIQVQGNMSG